MANLVNILAMPSWFDPWGVLAICAVVIIIAIAVIVLCVVKDKDKSKKTDEQAKETNETKNDVVTEQSDEKYESANGADNQSQQPAYAEEKEDLNKQSSESGAKSTEKQKVADKKPANKTASKTTATKTADKKTANKTTATKTTTTKTTTTASKTTTANKTTATATKTTAAAATAKVADDKPSIKKYHISKRKEDGSWQVKMAGGSKAIKLFETQAEAIAYAKKLADNQEASIVIHKEDGSFRRLNYNNK
jgi:FtsZ-interacting cell division protein ZipA